MPKTEVHPEALSEVNALDIDDDIRTHISELSQDVDYHRNQRGDWETRVDRWSQLRYGIRNKKTFPWPGAANYMLPLIDSDISRLKPAYVQLAFGVSPVVTYEPFGPEDVEPARKREMLMDFRIKNQMDFFKPYVIGVDKMLEKGFVVYKIYWRFETRTFTEFFDLEEMDPAVVQAMMATTDEMLAAMIEEELKPDMEFEENVEAIQKAIRQFRKGKTKIEIEFTEKEHDEPCVVAVDPKEDLTVPIDTQNLNDARFIDYKYWVSKNDLKRAMKAGKYEKYSDSDIESWISKSYEGRFVQAQRDGIMSYGRPDMILMHETCTWYDVNGDGIEERCISTWPDAAPNDVLRFIENPYDHGQWPYVQVKRELIDDWFYASRGIPALDEDFQVGISQKFNQDIDTQTIINTPTWITRKNAVKNIRNLKYVPGQWLEVEDPTKDAQLVQQPNLSQSTFLLTAQYLKGWANERIGSLNAGISSPTNLPGQAEGGKKTAKEISTVSMMSGQATALDLMVFQEQMAQVYYQIDALYEQFGPEEEELMTGEQVLKVSRREIQGKFNIVPTGKFDNSLPELRFAKSLNLLKIFGQDPDIRQYELKKQVMQDLDMRLSKKLLLTPEEIQMRDQQMQQQMEQQKRQALMEQITLKRVSNRLEAEKAETMAPIEGRKRQYAGRN